MSAYEARQSPDQSPWATKKWSEAGKWMDGADAVGAVRKRAALLQSLLVAKVCWPLDVEYHGVTGTI